MGEMKLTGSLTISRPRGGHGLDYIEIRLTDGLSGTTFVEAQVALPDFTEALVGLAQVPCEFEFRPERVGMKHEHKEEFVPLKDDYFYSNPGKSRDKITSEALAPFEVDGWQGRVNDLFNHHRRGKNGARVTFVRYVPAIEGSELKP